MKLERRYVVTSMVILLLILLILFLILYRSINSKFSPFGQPGPTPLPTPQPIPVSTTALPQGVTDPGDENTFTTATGYIFNADPDTGYASWKDAVNIQAQGKLIKWTDEALILKVQDGQLTIYTPVKLRYHCLPVMVAGINGKPPVKTQDIYSPIRNPETLGVVIDRDEVTRLLPPPQTIYVAAARQNDRLEAILVADYGCGYPRNNIKVNA
jgi:hypothetical protein